MRRASGKIVFLFYLLLVGAFFFNACGSEAPGHWRKPAPRPKVAIIGLDGATWEIIDQLIAQNKLPNLKYLIDTGTRADYTTIEPILSPLIWTTMATGVAPERHGITWFMVRDPRTGDPLPITSARREVKALWNIASEAGKTVGFVGWWATWPAEKVNGFIVSDQVGWHGFGMSEKKGEEIAARTFPEALYDGLKKEIVAPLSQPKSEIDPFMKITDSEYAASVGGSFNFSNPLHHFMYMIATLKTYEAIGLGLLKKNKPDLFGIYLESIDTAGHLYMKFRPPQVAGVSDDLYAKYSGTMDAVYERNDEALGKFLKVLAPGTTVFVCSDHGFKTGEDRSPLIDDNTVANAHKWHKNPGVLIINGPDIRQGYKLPKSSVFDFAPTVLYALGLPAAQDFDGKVLEGAFTPEFTASHPVRTVPTYQTGKRNETAPALPEGVSKEMEEKLKSLGYIGGAETAKEHVDSLDAIEVHFNRLDMYFRKGKWDEALAEAKSMVRIDAEDPRVWAALGETLAGTNSPKEALDAIEKSERLMEACRKNPPRLPNGALKYTTMDEKKVSSVLACTRALILMNDKKIDEAAKLFRKAQQLDSKNTVAYYNYAFMLEKNQRHDEALKAYLETVDRFPDHSWALNNLGNVYYRRGEYEKAIEYYDRTAKADPEHHDCHHNKGVALLKLARTEEAVTSFRKALELKPDFVPSLGRLGLILHTQKKYEEARDIFKKLSELSPDDPRVESELTELYLQTGDPSSARQNFEKLRALDPKAAAAFEASHPDLKK